MSRQLILCSRAGFPLFWWRRAGRKGSRDMVKKHHLKGERSVDSMTLVELKSTFLKNVAMR